MKALPARHWRSHGDDKLPTGAEALNEPFDAFPSWFLRITCDRCGKLQIINQAHAKWSGQTLRRILGRMRHDGCGGLAGKAELLSGSEGASSRPVRKIVLLLTALAVVLIGQVPTVAAAQPPDTVDIYGLGTSSCGSWTAARRERSQGFAWGYEQWLLGYISGLAMGYAHADTFNPLGGTDFNGVWAWIDSYCQTHPLDTIREAASGFTLAHPRPDKPN